jgi:hypothetical protein
VTSALLVQGIGAIAVLISLCIFQTNKRNKMLLLGMIASLFYVVHFFMLGAFTGAAMNLINAFSNYTYTKKKPNKRNRRIPYYFALLVTGATIASWQGALSLLPAGAMIIGLFGSWKKGAKPIRQWGLVASPLWLLYSLISGSYPGVFIEAVMIISNLIGQYRFDFTPKGSRRNPGPGRLARPATPINAGSSVGR